MKEIDFFFKGNGRFHLYTFNTGYNVSRCSKIAKIVKVAGGTVTRMSE
jgi:hypothetical protein